VLAQWVRPEIVVEVEYRQRNDGGLRHAVLKGSSDQPACQVSQSPQLHGGPLDAVPGSTQRADQEKGQ
jgi:hypothetical protein